MDTFSVNAKLWPSGDDLDLGVDSNNVTVPSSFNRHAANFVTSMDGEDTFQFLFWNTGRHLTNKRHVTWNFSVGGWGVWNATRWYGVPPTGGGSAHRVRADGFTLGGDAPLGTDTPINGPSSTFAPGAWPYQGDDHAIDTAGAAVDVVAKDPFHTLQFAGWLRLIWGGDDSGVFVETDTGASPGSSSFFEHSTGPFHAAKGSAHDLLATYGNKQGLKFGPIDWGDILAGPVGGIGPINPGDPGPDDWIRIAILKQLLSKTQPGAQGAVNFQQVIQNAQQMNAEELKRTKTALLTSLDLGKSALSTIDAQLRQRGGQ